MRFIPLEHVHELEEQLARLVNSPSRFVQRDALAMCLGLQGFRVSEVSLTKTDALDPHAGKITPPRIKRSKTRTLPLHPSLLAGLLAWRKGSDCPWLLFTGKGNRVFPSQLQRFCRHVTRDVFGYSYRFHSLRHTFAMRLYARTRDLLLVKKMLGHRSINSTLIYAEALDDVPRDLLVSIDQQPAAPQLLKEESSSPSSSSKAKPGAVDIPVGMHCNPQGFNVFRPRDAC
jgi:integrase/recombinase XerC